MPYLIDSDVFIQASNMHYQNAFCPAFWDWIDRGHKAGKIISIDKVLDEIVAGKHGPLAPWAQARPSLFQKSAEEAVLKNLTQVAIWARDNFKPAGYEKFYSGADFVLVGFAMTHGHVIVTQESTAQGSDKNIKIPDACRVFRIPCINTWELLEAEKPRFILE